MMEKHRGTRRKYNNKPNAPEKKLLHQVTRKFNDSLLPLSALEGPDTDLSIPPSFHQISILNPDPIDDRCRPSAIILETGSAVPMASISLIVDLDNRLANCRNYPAGIKLHACYRVIISKGIKDGAGPEVPDL